MPSDTQDKEGAEHDIDRATDNNCDFCTAPHDGDPSESSKEDPGGYDDLENDKDDMNVLNAKEENCDAAA